MSRPAYRAQNDRHALDRQAAGFQNLRESFAKIAIGEIDKAQAARS
jgi:hypothetical protein